MQKRIDSSGANGAWIPCNTSSPSQNKRFSQKAIREERYLLLLDEDATASASAMGGKRDL